MGSPQFRLKSFLSLRTSTQYSPPSVRRSIRRLVIRSLMPSFYHYRAQPSTHSLQTFNKLENPPVDYFPICEIISPVKPKAKNRASKKTATARFRLDIENNAERFFCVHTARRGLARSGNARQCPDGQGKDIFNTLTAQKGKRTMTLYDIVSTDKGKLIADFIKQIEDGANKDVSFITFGCNEESLKTTDPVPCHISISFLPRCNSCSPPPPI